MQLNGSHNRRIGVYIPNNNNSQCESRFRGVWGDPTVGNLAPTGISTHREVDSLRPTKTVFLKKVYKENDYKP